MFQPSDPVAITLMAQEWDQILTLLAEHPYKVSASLIDKIRQQAQQKGDQASLAQAQRSPIVLPNGQATAPIEN